MARKPELHRRLIFFSTCALLVAAFARIDHAILRMHSLQYLCPDLLLSLGAGRDLLVNRRVHKVLQSWAAGISGVAVDRNLLMAVAPEWWIHFTHAIAG